MIFIWGRHLMIPTKGFDGGWETRLDWPVTMHRPGASDSLEANAAPASAGYWKYAPSRNIANTTLNRNPASALSAQLCFIP